MEYQRHHGNPWNINVEIRGKFHGITCYRGISMESHGTPYKLHWFSMEIPWRISVRVGLKFRQRLEETVTMVCYAKFENLIEVDRNRNVIFDFGV